MKHVRWLALLIPVLAWLALPSAESAQRHRLYAPIVMRSGSEPTATPTSTPLPSETPTPTNTPVPTTPPPSGWLPLLTEDFEDDEYGPLRVGDNNGPAAGEYLWAKSSCQVYEGSYSGWAVGGGSDGSRLTCGSNYPNEADSYMIAGPFDLSDATAGTFSSKLWTYTEEIDVVCKYASINGNDFSGYCWWGDSDGWFDDVLDLRNVERLGDVTGEPEIWIAQVFRSSAHTNYAEGAFVDNLLLQKYVPRRGATIDTPPAVPEPVIPDGVQRVPAHFVRGEQP